MNKKYFKPLVIIIALIIVCITTIASYAYFVASVSSNTSANVITTGNMEVTYENGQEIETTENMIPGDYVTKTFSVTNTGDVYALYDIYLNEVINDFVNTDELVYELISEDGTNLSQRECPTTSGVIASGIGIDVGQTHHYTLKLIFLNKDYSQDANQGKIFSAKIELQEGITLTKKSRVVYYLPYDENTTYVPNYDLSSYNRNNIYYVKSFGDSYVYETNNAYGIEIDEIEDYESCDVPDGSYISYECNEVENGIHVKYIQYGSIENPASLLFIDEEKCNLFIEQNNIENGTCKLLTSDEPMDIVYTFKSNRDNQICIYSNNEEKCIDKPVIWGTEELKSQEVKDFKHKMDEFEFDCKYSKETNLIFCKDPNSDYYFMYNYNHYTAGSLYVRHNHVDIYEARLYNMDIPYSTLEDCFDNTIDNHNCAYKNGSYYDYEVIAENLEYYSCKDYIESYTYNHYGTSDTSAYPIWCEENMYTIQRFAYYLFADNTFHADYF
ncbi:MAG: hypothetical protein E7159_00595 [Firmicutes bacterium]|nr:hypothetical protein [Bacillota bacterium]